MDIESKQADAASSNEEEPQVFHVARQSGGHQPGDRQTDRRNFIKQVALSAATTVVVSGCSFQSQKVDTQATIEAAVAATDTYNKAYAEAERKLNMSMANNTQAAIDTTSGDAPATEVPPTETETPEPPTETPAPTETETPSLPTGGIKTTIKGDNVNFRSGPGTGYPSITQLPYGAEVLMTSRLEDSTWVGVSLADPKKKGKTVEGWIKTVLLQTKDLDIKSLPVITDLPPTPTPLPGKLGNTGVGDTGINYDYTDEYGHTYSMTLPCGSTVPSGAVCTCNCVTVPRSCSCNNNTGCSCDDIHYWYPN